MAIEELANITVGNVWAWLLGFAAAIVALSKAWDVISARLKPHRDLKAKVDSHDVKLAADMDRIGELENQIDEQKKFNAVVCRALFAQINHELSGNGNDILRHSRDELQTFLTNR